MNMARPPTTLAGLMGQLEDLWQKVDTILLNLGPADWTRRHGKDWTFADVPYHLAYFDRDVVAAHITAGEQVLPGEERPLRSFGELDAWNARKFAERPASQSPEQSVAQMQAARDLIRQAVAGMGDADLQRRIWFPMVGGGWVTLQRVLESGIAHTWNHLMELRLRLGRSQPAPTPEETHRVLNFFMSFMPVMLNQSQAANKRFTGVMEITGPGGGEWTIQVVDGSCKIQPGRVPQTDMVMTQSVETFHAVQIGAQNPMLAMLTRKIKVRGLRQMGTFAKLFPPPKPETVIEANTEGATAIG